MAGRKASAFLFLLVVLAIAAGGWLLFRGSAPPKPVPGETGPPPVAPTGTGTSREACLEFLRVQASPVRLTRGSGPVILHTQVRIDALDALAAVDPAAAGPLVLAALGGDGDPEDWSDVRLHAAGIRVRAGMADGTETVRAYLKAGEDLADGDASVEALRAAAALPPAEGAGVVRRILAEKAEDLGEEVLVAALQAAAALGDGSTPAELQKHLAADEWLVRGAAAGALLRIGDASGTKLAEGIEWPDSEDFALGLGVAGNEAVLPLLGTMLKGEETFTRAAAARALGAVGGPKAVALLGTAAKDADSGVKACVAVSLALLGSKDELPAVRAATADKDPEIAIAAWKALALAGDGDSRAAAEALLSAPLPGPKDGSRGLVLQKRVWAAALIVHLGK